VSTGPLVRELEDRLRAVGDDARAAGAKAYLKSDLQFIGVAAAPLRAVAREFLADHPDLEGEKLVELVRDLFGRPVFELRAVAVALLERRVRDVEVNALELVEDLLRQSETWALVDWLATKIAAPLVDRHAESARPVLQRWSLDDDFWQRRASLLALLPALRAGGGEFDLFVTFAVPMLGEREFFIRKALGWVLREVGKKRPHLTSTFLAAHVDEVSSLTLKI
jgi:3-methyladenine DNA glycosylase AlkD